MQSYSAALVDSCKLVEMCFNLPIAEASGMLIEAVLGSLQVVVQLHGFTPYVIKLVLDASLQRVSSNRYHHRIGC